MIQKLLSHLFSLLLYLSSALPLHLSTCCKWASHSCYKVNQNTLKSARASTNNTNWSINIEALEVLPQQVSQISNQAKPFHFNSAAAVRLAWRHTREHKALARATVFNTTLIKPAPSKFNQRGEQHGFREQGVLCISVSGTAVNSAAKIFC